MSEIADIKNTKDMRAFLVQQMVDVAQGKLEVTKARAICNISQQIYNTINIEIRVAKSGFDDSKAKGVQF